MKMDSPENNEELKIIFEDYKLAVQTQMHFNEMIMRMRTTAISIFLAVIGAAAISLQYNTFLSLCCYTFHASVLIIFVGLGMMISVALIDYFYYNKMLIGAVRKSYKIDDKVKDKKLLGSDFLGLSTLIRDAIGPPGASSKYIKIFYLIPMVIGTVFMLLIFIYYKQIIN